VGAVSRDVVDTRLLEFADQVRGYWVSVQADAQSRQRGGRGGGNRGPALRAHAGGADLDWVWQIAEGGEVTLRSELLLLTKATLPIRNGVISDASDAAFSLRDVETPLGPMRIAERVINEPLPFTGTGKPASRRLHYLVGVRSERYLDYVEDHAARLRGLALLAAAPIALALFGLSAVIIFATRQSLGELTDAMRAYENGDTDRIEGNLPRELQGIADRLNALLSHNAKLVERTRKYVSKIAHDINHPLAILKNALQGDNDPDLMNRQLDRMVGLVDRYSSLARAIGPEGQTRRQTPIAEMLDDVVSGFSILYRRTPLTFECHCDPDLAFAVPRHDLEAMMSNLVSNAHKYGDSHVALSAETSEDGALRLTVEDDGPGIPEADRIAAMNWGSRLDEAPPGTGFGLSIVQDIADLYQGRLILNESELGGLSATVEIPKPAAPLSR
ncbi:HAMP domain-containing sensor histidine kinase, partial [Moritella sp.]|uniref:sensor histidine kinase n=1 Tax=Moritella sp. TaxID=78556 RepID=UPI0025CE0132